MSEETLSSREAEEIPYVKEIVFALHPWPLSNERAWWIVADQLKPLFSRIERLEKQLARVRTVVVNDGRAWRGMRNMLEEIDDIVTKGR